MTHISYELYYTCPECKKFQFHEIKIIEINRAEHTCSNCGHIWHTQ